MSDRIPDASIVIVTKDRWDELERAIRSAVRQDGTTEVIVVDDGSTDGSPDLVERHFPDVRIVRNDSSRGYIVRRNEAARIARAPIVVSIDDDAAFEGVDTVVRLVPLFDDARIGAAALPHVDLLQGEQVLQESPPGDSTFVTACFRGTAYAVRRDAFLELGGFRESLFHQAEEQDFCLRLLDSRRVVVLARTPPIRHYASPRRDNLRAWVYGPRNDVLFAWHNVPMPGLLTRLARVSAYELMLGARVRRPGVFAKSLLNGYVAAARRRQERKPVSRKTYELYSALERRGPRPLEQTEI